MTVLPTDLANERGYTQGDLGPKGWWLDLHEETPELIWPRSVDVYERMRRQDAEIAAVLRAVTLPIRRAEWRLDPGSAPSDVVRLVSDDLGLPILGDKNPPRPNREAGRVSWTEHLRLALLSLVFGHMPFEQVYAIEGGQARLKRLAPRLPKSILRWDVNPDGSLKQIVQWVPNNVGQMGALSGLDGGGIPITADRLVVYVNEREGGSWVGQSLLRGAYAPWLVKQRLIRVGAINIERWGAGIPKGVARDGASTAQITDMAKLAQTARAGEAAGAGLPAGFDLIVEGIRGTVPDPMPLIHYFDAQIAKIMLAQFLELGSSAHGSRALGQSFVDFFTLSIQAIAEELADTATTQIVEDLVDLNFGSDVAAPRIVCADVGSEQKLTAQAISELMTCGALTPDPTLEQFVRDTYSLPARTATTPPPAVPPPAAASRARRGQRVEAATGGLRRQPTAVEAAAKTDFTKLQGDWQSALDTLVNDWSDISRAQREQLVAQIRAAVKASDVQALAALAVDSQDAADRLATAMSDAADQAASDMTSEADAQGVTVPAGDISVDTDRITATAAAFAALMGAALATSAARKALQSWGPSSSAADVATAVDDHLSSLTDSGLADQLGGALTLAQNAGRSAVLDAAPAPDILAASEVLDSNTCEACAAIDGHEFDTRDQAEAAYAGGGYSDCQGGLRCRGILVAVWDASSVDQAA